MKVCTQCHTSEVDDLENCRECGGELRRRSISEAFIDLLNTNAGGE